MIGPHLPQTNPRDTHRRPLVTVITPAYNRADLIAETIESVLNQDYPNLEYIVLDDGSGDNTLAVVKRYEGHLRCLSHPNRGEARTVNRGFELAEGAIIGVVNSDDPLLPGAIRAIVDAFLADSDVLVVYPDWQVIDDRGAVLHRIAGLDYDYLEMVRWHFSTPGPGTFFRRSVVDRIGGRDPSFQYVSDYDFWLRAGLLGPFRRLPCTLATWRAHPASATSAERGEVMAKEHIRVIDKLYSLPGLPPEVLAVKTEAYRNAFYVAGTACGADPAALGERFQWRDALHQRIFEPGSETPLDMVAQLHAELTDREARFAQLYESFLEQHRTIDWLHGEVAERDKTIEWLHREVTERDRLIAQHRGHTDHTP